ncbi:hypothetical protein BDV11DRAFT_109875 [Aspergillus similis]
METESGAKIAIRGKGSVKEGKGRSDAAHASNQEEDLHCLIMADTEEKVNKAKKLVHNVIETAASIPEGQNELKRNQLRELAALNGTLRDDENQACQNCGQIGHRKYDCPDGQPVRRIEAGPDGYDDRDYKPWQRAPPPSDVAPWQQRSGRDNRRDDYGSRDNGGAAPWATQGRGGNDYGYGAGAYGAPPGAGAAAPWQQAAPPPPGQAAYGYGYSAYPPPAPGMGAPPAPPGLGAPPPPPGMSSMYYGASGSPPPPPPGEGPPPPPPSDQPPPPPPPA